MSAPTAAAPARENVAMKLPAAGEPAKAPPLAGDCDVDGKPAVCGGRVTIFSARVSTHTHVKKKWVEWTLYGFSLHQTRTSMVPAWASGPVHPMRHPCPACESTQSRTKGSCVHPWQGCLSWELPKKTRAFRFRFTVRFQIPARETKRVAVCSVEASKQLARVTDLKQHGGRGNHVA